MTARNRQNQTPRPGAKKKFPIIPVAIGVAVVALITTVILTFEGDTTEDAFGTPELSGDGLTLYAAGGFDPAVGQASPTVVGADFEGNPVEITDDGRAKIILFLAHWCPHCQAEVPIVQSWVNAGSLPVDVDLYAVATSIDRMRPNYPPSKWLEDEGWTEPILVDDELTSVARAYELNAFPYWVFVAADGTVFGRLSGRLGVTELDQLTGSLLQG
jgi:thiol-disulfide isomerase/thioredoxin